MRPSTKGGRGAGNTPANVSGGGARRAEREVIEVVAEPMEEEGPENGYGDAARRLKRGLGPVLAGIIIDVVDISTFTPMVGFSLGALCGMWLSGHLGFGLRQRFLASLACGVYCMFPPTNFFPLATMLGVWANFREGR